MAESSVDLLHKLILKYSNASPGSFDIPMLTEDLRQLTGASYVVFNEVTHNEKSTTTRHISGVKNSLEKAVEMLGFSLTGASYSLDPEILSVFQQEGVVEFSSLCELSASQIPLQLCSRLCRIFGVGRVYAIGLKNGKKLLADLIFIMKKGNELTLKKEVELFAGFIQVLLQRQSAAETSVLEVLASYREESEANAPLMEAIFQATDRIPDLVYQLDSEGRFVFVNQAIQRYGYLREDLLGRSILEIVHPDDRDVAYWPLRERRTGERKTRDFEVRLITGSRKTAFFKFNETTGPELPVIVIQAEGLYDRGGEDGAFYGTIGIGHDVTAEKQLSMELNRQSQIFRIIAENAGAAIWLEKLDPYEVYYLNPAAEQMFFSEGGNSGTDPTDWLRKVHPEDRDSVKRFLEENLSVEEAREFEYRLIDGDGQVRWIISRLFPVYQAGELTDKFVGIATDTTRQKLEKTRLENMVEIEKVYMREMNHRVKNNLAMIDSLLGLELARLSEHPDGADEVLRKVKGRIQAVGQVHEMLIGVSDREMVDTSEYLKTLAESLFNTDSRSRGQISVEYSLEDGLRFPVGTAIAQGMIMTELIINALKYAFPYDPRGKVRIAFGSSPGDRCFLSVGDDGIPLPPHWEEKGSGNIGMDLISVLVKQLNGDFLIEQKDDFKNFTVTFPAAHVSAG